MRKTTASLLCCGTLLLTSTIVAAASASTSAFDPVCNPPGSGGFVIFRSGTQVAQSFTAGYTAPLLSADLLDLHRQPGGTGGPVVVDVQSTDPTTRKLTGTVLASAQIPSDQIPATAITYDATVNFGPAAALLAGQTYALVLSTADTAQNGWELHDADQCDGNLWQGSSGTWSAYPTYDSPFVAHVGAPNDAFHRAIALPGTTADSAGTTYGATRQSSEPDHYEMNVGGDIDWVGEHSVWYRWRSLGTGPVALDTCEAAIDSIVAVYTGDTLGGLTRVTDGNNGCGTGWDTVVSFPATAGTTYRIAVGDAGGATQSTFNLHLVGPPNEAPTVEKLRPTDGATITDRTPTIAATVRDSATDLTANNLVLRLDGQIKAGFSYDRTTDRLTYTSNQLTLGTHTARIRAVDAQGLATVREWSFRVT